MILVYIRNYSRILKLTDTQTLTVTVAMPNPHFGCEFDVCMDGREVEFAHSVRPPYLFHPSNKSKLNTPLKYHLAGDMVKGTVATDGC